MHNPLDRSNLTPDQAARLIEWKDSTSFRETMLSALRRNKEQLLKDISQGATNTNLPDSTHRALGARLAILLETEELLTSEELYARLPSPR